jgi:signal peptidase
VLARLLPWAVRGIVAVAIVAFAGLAIGPHVFGYRTLTMLTASMSPAIDPGDVVVVTPVAISEVTEGMVITYHIPVEDHHLVTHRVVSVDQAADGTVTVQTKGDANEAVDPWQATLEGDTAYQVRAVVPEVGHVLQALRTPVVSQVMTYGATALVAGWLLLGIWRPAKKEFIEIRSVHRARKADRTKTGPTNSRRASQRAKREHIWSGKEAKA